MPNAAHAAFAGQRTVTPRSRDGMIESLRVLMACRKTAVSARRVALQMIHNTIVCAPDTLRDQLAALYQRPRWLTHRGIPLSREINDSRWDGGFAPCQQQ